MNFFRCFSVCLVIVLGCSIGFAAPVQQSATSATLKSASKKVASKSKKSQKDTLQYEAYRGKWYGLYFPLGWTVSPSLRGNDGADDSVFFTAPDSSAEFYVYCPRYSGKPTDIELKRSTEEQLGQTIEEKDGVRIRTVRIKAKDESYMRAFEDTVAFMVGRRLVFGFKFRDEAARVKYNPVYVYFKSSFRKFTD
ncbi:MAG: hypothetical protein MUF71_16745 [Candidatus Kapabacteria bacterium]|jgi:hypothetical protein|nr:hypothetical protein [Candidatus Kapabacteria bacterium]